jgi:hypothetical protein
MGQDNARIPPAHLILEMTADGTDYLVGTDAAGNTLVKTWPEVHAILVNASEKLSQQAIRERWPVEADPPDCSTLWHWLKRPPGRA